MVEEMTPLKVVSVGDTEIQGAAAILRRFVDQDLTMTDAVGLYTMEKLSVSSCWSTDFNLGLMGVPLVIHRL